MTSMSANRIIMTCFVALVGVVIAVAQPQGTTRIEGKVTDEVTGKPVGCKIDVAIDGKKQSLSSNASDGTYLVLLNTAGEATFTFRGHTVERREEKMNIPKSTKFQDIKHDFKVRSVIEGTPVFSLKGFDRNAATLTQPAVKELEALKERLRVNAEMRVVIKVTADEDQMAAVKAKNEADHGKAVAEWKKTVAKLKKKKGAELPPEPVKPADPSDPNGQLVKDRVAAVKSALADVKNGDMRITYVEQQLPASAAPTTPPPVVATEPKGKKSKTKVKAAEKTTGSTAAASSSAHPTLVCEIGKVKKLFD